MNATTQQTQQVAAEGSHPFAHLGPAPYRYVGRFAMPDKSLLSANPEAYYQQVGTHALQVEAGLGSCAHCGTAITQVYIIECGDKKRYGVGCDCVMKVSREPQLISAVRKEKNRLAKEKKYSKLEAELEWYHGNQELLASFPHPKQYFADQGKTLLDYLRWYMLNAGAQGKMKALAQARKVVGA